MKMKRNSEPYDKKVVEEEEEEMMNNNNNENDQDTTNNTELLLWKNDLDSVISSVDWWKIALRIILADDQDIKVRIVQLFMIWKLPYLAIAWFTIEATWWLHRMIIQYKEYKITGTTQETRIRTICKRLILPQIRNHKMTQKLKLQKEKLTMKKEFVTKQIQNSKIKIQQKKVQIQTKIQKQKHNNSKSEEQPEEEVVVETKRQQQQQQDKINNHQTKKSKQKRQHRRRRRPLPPPDPTCLILGEPDQHEIYTLRKGSIPLKKVPKVPNSRSNNSSRYGLLHPNSIMNNNSNNNNNNDLATNNNNNNQSSSSTTSILYLPPDQQFPLNGWQFFKLCLALRQNQTITKISICPYHLGWIEGSSSASYESIQYRWILLLESITHISTLTTIELQLGKLHSIEESLLQQYLKTTFYNTTTKKSSSSQLCKFHVTKTFVVGPRGAGFLRSLLGQLVDIGIYILQMIQKQQNQQQQQHQTQQQQQRQSSTSIELNSRQQQQQYDDQIPWYKVLVPYLSHFSSIHLQQCNLTDEDIIQFVTAIRKISNNTTNSNNGNGYYCLNELSLAGNPRLSIATIQIIFHNQQPVIRSLDLQSCQFNHRDVMSIVSGLQQYDSSASSNASSSCILKELSLCDNLNIQKEQQKILKLQQQQQSIGILQLIQEFVKSPRKSLDISNCGYFSKEILIQVLNLLVVKENNNNNNNNTLECLHLPYRLNDDTITNNSNNRRHHQQQQEELFPMNLLCKVLTSNTSLRQLYLPTIPNMGAYIHLSTLKELSTVLKHNVTLETLELTILPIIVNNNNNNIYSNIHNMYIKDDSSDDDDDDDDDDIFSMGNDGRGGSGSVNLTFLNAMTHLSYDPNWQRIYSEIQMYLQLNYAGRQYVIVPTTAHVGIDSSGGVVVEVEVDVDDNDHYDDAKEEEEEEEGPTKSKEKQRQESSILWPHILARASNHPNAIFWLLTNSGGSFLD